MMKSLNKFTKSSLKTQLTSAAVIVIAIAFPGCTNSLLPNKNILALPSAIPSIAFTSVPTKLVISTVTVGSQSTTSVTPAASPTPAAGNSQIPSVNVFFDTVKSTTPISTYCSSASATSGQSTASDKNCMCQFRWNEINPNSGTDFPIGRQVTTPLTQVQPNAVSCNAPDVYSTEIPFGTQINITVIPALGNSTGYFSIPSYTYTKPSISTGGSFQDSQGQLFSNIFHYSCYQKFIRGMTIQSKINNQQLPNALQPKPVVLASQFCIAKSGSGGADTSNCPYLPNPDYSAQAYYVNLYIRDSERGDINQSNLGYTCPIVAEPLQKSTGAGSQNQFWPMDTNFALSLGPTSSYSVGVEAHTKLSNGSDPTSGSSSCTAPTGDSAEAGGAASANSSGLSRSCLGFAAKVNADGTCPAIKDSSNLIRPTFRLRRYVAVYPKVFDTDGSPMANQAQAVDTIYVLDRPVQSFVNSDPLKPFTMLGPKPCPFAFFDKKGVVASGTRGYYSTSNPNWAGKNIDGIEFPNIDGFAEDGSPSCSAILPIPNKDKTVITLSTVNKYVSAAQTNTRPGVTIRDHLYVRPVQPFIPHYEEDTDFQACAPQSDPIKDAPLHFSRDYLTGNVAWCSEAYPSQNPNIASLDPPVLPTPTPAPSIGSGKISPYTSHLVRNSASTPCSATPITWSSTYSYPAAGPNSGYARHNSGTFWSAPYYDNNPPYSLTLPKYANQTCDRTVLGQGLDWTRFPLLAPAPEIESSIIEDSSYQCTITFDNKGGKANKFTPADGCCDISSVSVTSGSKTPAVGHLEPDVPCKIPHY